MDDWIADPSLSREEKLSRFAALGPEQANTDLCVRCGDPERKTLRLLTRGGLGLTACGLCAAFIYSALSLDPTVEK